MEQQDVLVLRQSDFQRLSALVNTVQSETSELLEEELLRASVVADTELPEDVVAMDSRVQFCDTETGKELLITLVYPHKASIEQSKISILTPVGSALIGLKVGQVIQWPFPNGKLKELKVIEVTHSK